MVQMIFLFTKGWFFFVPAVQGTRGGKSTSQHSQQSSPSWTLLQQQQGIRRPPPPKKGNITNPFHSKRKTQPTNKHKPKAKQKTNTNQNQTKKVWNSFLGGGWTNPFEEYIYVKLDHFPKGEHEKYSHRIHLYSFPFCSIPSHSCVCPSGRSLAVKKRSAKSERSAWRE